MAIGIAPDQVRGIAHRFGVARHVARQQANELEAVAQLEAHGRVAVTPFLYGLDIGIDRAHGLDSFLEAGQAATEHDAVQAELAAQLLARRIQAPADAHAAEFRIDAGFHAVQPVAFGIVPRGIAAAGDLGPGVRPHRGRLVDAEGCAEADDAPVVLGHELPLRKLRLLSTQHVRGMAEVDAIDLGGQRDETVDVPRFGIAYAQGGVLFGWHGGPPCVRLDAP